MHKNYEVSYELFEKMCEKRKKTAYKVAKATGIPTATLYEWKSGKSTPKTDKLLVICDYLKCNIKKLVREIPDATDSEVVR